MEDTNGKEQEVQAIEAQEPKKKKYLADQFIVLIILTYALILLSGFPQYFVAALLAPLSETVPDLPSLVHYFSTLGYWLVFLLFMAIYKPDRPLIRSLFTGKTNTWKFFLIGLGAGLVTNGSCILVSVLHQDISLYFDPSSIPMLILCFLAVIIQSGSEELICRHFMQQHLRRRYQKPWLEILLPGFFFAALHLFNPGISVIAVINLVLCGICCLLRFHVACHRFSYHVELHAKRHLRSSQFRDRTAPLHLPLRSSKRKGFLFLQRRFWRGRFPDGASGAGDHSVLCNLFGQKKEITRPVIPLLCFVP